MPRAGLTPAAVVAAGAQLADETGFAELTMGALADRLGVRTPSLYKHVTSQDALHRGIAALALTEAAEAMGAAIQGRSGKDALAAAADALRDFVVTHPGRYAATIDLTPTGPGDPLAVAAARGLAPLEAVLRGYDIPSGDVVHALRAVRSVFHGFATLQADGGFQYDTDVDDSFDWLVELLHQGLCARAGAAAGGRPAAGSPAG